MNSFDSPLWLAILMSHLPLLDCMAVVLEMTLYNGWGSRLIFKSIALKFTSCYITMEKRFYLSAQIMASLPTGLPVNHPFY